MLSFHVVATQAILKRSSTKKSAPKLAAKKLPTKGKKSATKPVTKKQKSATKASPKPKQKSATKPVTKNQKSAILAAIPASPKWGACYSRACLGLHFQTSRDMLPDVWVISG